MNIKLLILVASGNLAQGCTGTQTGDYMTETQHTAVRGE